MMVQTISHQHNCERCQDASIVALVSPDIISLLHIVMMASTACLLRHSHVALPLDSTRVPVRSEAFVAILYLKHMQSRAKQSCIVQKL
ncbi:hypothetical protein WN944_023225 [Citrus x changshan-huyou]|uniref:Uncharacterized protein n=1 Tax=Citrus x changshan-huyou TaxID=2935761 RepID=A0AAP0N212_9ROSI